ncbi:unnamed protein product, partial [Rotaria sordida]
MMKNSIKLNLFYWLINIIFPPLNGKRLIGIILINSSKNLCKLIENDQYILSKMGFFKEINRNDFLKHILISLFQIISLFICLFLIDTNILNDKLFRLKNVSINNLNDELNEEELDDDVLQERITLISNKNLSLYPIVSFDIIKKYPHQQYLA